MRRVEEDAGGMYCAGVGGVHVVLRAGRAMELPYVLQYAPGLLNTWCYVRRQLNVVGKNSMLDSVRVCVLIVDGNGSQKMGIDRYFKRTIAAMLLLFLWKALCKSWL